MGWLSRAASWVGSKVGGAIETIGKWTGNEKWESVGRNIKDFCDNIGETRSYDKGTASATDTANINEMLTLFSSKLKDQADELEENVLKDVREYFEDVISQIEDSGVEIPTKQFHRAMTQTERNIKGKLKSHLAKRVSIDDQECLDILALAPGSEKTSKMDKFGNKVLKDGLDQLAKQTEQTVQKYNLELHDLLNQLLEQQEKNLNQIQSQFNEILEQANGEMIDKEAAKLKPAILLKSVEHLEKAVS